MPNDYKPVDKKQLERAYFFLSHQETFKKALYTLGFLIIVMIYALVVINLIRFYSGSGYESIAMLVSQNRDWRTFHNSRAPQDVTVLGTKAISTGGGLSTLVATVQNPNTDFSVREIRYHFVVNGEPLEEQVAAFNPGQQRLLMKTGYEARANIGSLTVEILDTKWRRFENDLPEVTWDIQDIQYDPVRTVELEPGEFTQLPPTVSWSVQNVSLNDFWNVGFQVVLVSDSNIVGAQLINARDFRSLETRDMRAVWNVNLPRITDVIVYPIMDLLDESNFKPLDT